MSKRNKVNKDFDVQCASGNLVINPADGTYQCVSKESPNSKKFNVTPCELFACPHFRQIKHEKIGEKEQKIRKYIQQGKPVDWVIENVPCSRRHYFNTKKRLEEEGILNNEHGDLEEEKKALDKIEPIKDNKITPFENASNESKQVTQLKNKNEQTKLKIPRIRLMLNDRDRFPTYREALTYAIWQRYRWTSDNVREIKDYIKPLLQKMPQSRIEGLSTILRIVDLHQRSLIQRGCSPALIIADSTPSEYLFGGRYTLKEIWNEYGLELPPELDSQKYDLIEERGQLLDLYLELERVVVKQLETLEYLEAQYAQLKSGTLNSYQKTELKAKLLTNPNYQYDPLYPEIKEILGLK